MISFPKVTFKKKKRNTGLDSSSTNIKECHDTPGATQQAFMFHENLKNVKLHAHFEKCLMAFLNTLIFSSCGFYMELQ